MEEWRHTHTHTRQVLKVSRRTEEYLMTFNTLPLLSPTGFKCKHVIRVCARTHKTQQLQVQCCCPSSFRTLCIISSLYLFVCVRKYHKYHKNLKDESVPVNLPEDKVTDLETAYVFFIMPAQCFSSSSLVKRLPWI